MNQKKDGIVEITDQRISEIRQQISSQNDIQNIFDSLDEANASSAFDILMGVISIFSASDIHIDASEQGARIRIRVDSMLYDVANINTRLYELVLYRIKLLSGLKINIKDAQDGSFSLRQTSNEIELRVSTIPSEYGEDIALRVLDPKKLISLTELGMRPDLSEKLEASLKTPEGMFIITGPTGSGKTTTLYAILKYLQNPSVKIVTIEDPIEYHLSGISQTQVNEKDNYTFDAGLKAILRQDPDIVMIGELRNQESAHPAIQASLVGKRIFSTLHTNDASGVIPRLEDLGIDKSSIASGLTMAMAQRLLRRLCNSCKAQRPTTNEEKDVFRKILNNIPSEILKDVSLDFVYDQGQVACMECQGNGFKGMIGVYEIFFKTKELEHLINQGIEEETATQLLKDQGMVTMQQDAAIRILGGVTSIGEAERILGSLKLFI